jgi:uncharacterized protein
MITIDQARQWYTAADPVHDFEHVLRVYRLAERIGQAEGADLEILLAAVLLHDAADAAPDSDGDRPTHHLASADFAHDILINEGWPPDRIDSVRHCIRAHRFRGTEKPQTLEAKILYDCDKLDVTGAIGVVRTVAYAALAGQPLLSEPSDSFKATLQKEPGEPHTPYHEFLFKLSRVQFHTATAQAIAQERGRYMAEFFERLRCEAHGQD